MPSESSHTPCSPFTENREFTCTYTSPRSKGGVLCKLDIYTSLQAGMQEQPMCRYRRAVNLGEVSPNRSTG